MRPRRCLTPFEPLPLDATGRRSTPLDDAALVVRLTRLHNARNPTAIIYYHTRERADLIRIEFAQSEFSLVDAFVRRELRTTGYTSRLRDAANRETANEYSRVFFGNRTRGSDRASSASFLRDRKKSGRRGAVAPNCQSLEKSSVTLLLVLDDAAGERSAASRVRFRALDKRSHGTVVPGAGFAASDSITDAIDVAKLSFVGWWRDAAPKHTHPT